MTVEQILSVVIVVSLLFTIGMWHLRQKK